MVACDNSSPGTSGPPWPLNPLATHVRIARKGLAQACNASLDR
jgi:hypothetical protein